MGHAATTARVLVVDDDEQVRCVIRRILEKRGHLVDDAADLDAARALLLEHPPSLILLDLDLGGKNGLELLNASPWSKAGTHAFAAPVIILSGYCDEATIQRSYAAGAT